MGAPQPPIRVGQQRLEGLVKRRRTLKRLDHIEALLEASTRRLRISGEQALGGPVAIQRTSSAPGTSWNGAGPAITPTAWTRSPAMAAVAKANGPPPDEPDVRNRSRPYWSATWRVILATDPMLNGVGVDPP